MSRGMTKCTKRHVHPMKTQISLGICPIWAEPLLCTQRLAKDPTSLRADSLGWSDFSLGARHFVGFVMVWLNCSHFRQEIWSMLPVLQEATLVLRWWSYVKRLWSSLMNVPKKIWYIWALSRENLSSGFETRVDSIRPAQPQKIGRGLKFQV